MPVSNHPNRGSCSPSRNPTPAEIVAARLAAGLSQTAAAALLHTTCRTWQQWEAGDRRMHPAFWELFLLKSRSKSAI
jgi:DNA-binding transcriptional regulator YiaG